MKHVRAAFARLARRIVHWLDSGVLGYSIQLRLRSKEDLRRDEEAARLHEQLERSARFESIGQLAGGVAHDFNNMLAVILNYASFVQNDLPEGDPRRDDLEEIRKAAGRGRDLTHQLLVFSRRELAAPEVVDVAAAIDATENLLKRTLGEHIRLESRAAPGLLRVMLGAGQMEQMLVNLAINARDAMSSGGLLEIEADNVERPGALPVVRLRVRDHGEGMPPEVLERALEPFFTTKPPGEGTGLGLATLHGIITRAAGRVEIESAEGEGTTVTIELPATEERPAVGEPALAPAAGSGSGAGRSVLIVEDEESVRALTARTLRENGYRVIEARDGSEGLRRLRRAGGSIDVLLTDLVMPGLSGRELGERAREHLPGLPVVYVSGYGPEAAAASSAGELPADVLTKPFDRETLLRAVEDALGERRAAV